MFFNVIIINISMLKWIGLILIDCMSGINIGVSNNMVMVFFIIIFIMSKIVNVISKMSWGCLVICVIVSVSEIGSCL